ncbi:unnamed protein product, partial [Mesorhabditis belari]|uniref:Peptidase metallopeptidase domain-containing protein n=1 Tax=Mesorhabditis belari TaxID=2138241 RepID=A0AAF3EBY4_9BILA
MYYGLVFLVLFALTIGEIKAFPKNLKESRVPRVRVKRRFTEKNAMDYLRDFDYLPRWMEIGYGAPDGNKSKVKVTEAIKLQTFGYFQQRAALPQTGQLDAETMREMSRSRCGNPDPRDPSKTLNALGRTVAKWDRSEVTYSILNSTDDLPRATIKKAIGDAFQLWSNVIPLNFREVDENGDIKFSFKVRSHGDGNPFDGRGNVLAHASHPAKEPLSAYTHFDDDEWWTNKDGEEIEKGNTDFFHTAIHEIGHNLGLDHLNEKKSIMHEITKPDNLVDRYGRYIEPRLHHADIEAVQKIYGNRTRATVTVTGTLNPENGTKTVTCPTRVDAVFADAGITFIFMGNETFEINAKRKILKKIPIPSLFPDGPKVNFTVVLDHITKKLLVFEHGGDIHAYYYSRLFHGYRKAYTISSPFWRPLSGAFSLNSGATFLLDTDRQVAVYSVLIGSSSPFMPVHSNFPTNVRGSIRATDDDSKHFLFTPTRVYLYNGKQEVVEKEWALDEWLSCK